MLFDFMKSKKRILIIDDDMSLVRLIKFHLEEKYNDYEIYYDNEGLSGYEHVKKLNPDLILLDWVLPDTSGKKILTKLKSDSQTREIPVIMLTGKTQISDIEDAFDHEVNDYITKPFPMNKLSQKIYTQLEAALEAA